MFLKRLEIAGFKSFYEKIKLDFPAGITAVVGPNGSGKSNIGDAIRWVMGEQSAKSLRGTKMEDVIFAGTAHRRPLGYAEVQMLIDNSNRILPVEYNEVNVTRRVFRSGESEYLLNGTPVRMRDIRGLFMDTGVGREGYSIIGQGRVDEILSSRSEDRRQLFEEAAGIVKYKSRRHEAFVKLDAERQNLLRAEDLIEELQGQLAPLGEQAEAAKAYLRLRDEYKIIHVNLFLQEAAQAEEQSARTKEQLSDLSRQSEAEEDSLKTAQEALSALKQRETETETEYKEINRRIIKRITAIEKAGSNMRIKERIEKEIESKRQEISEAVKAEKSLAAELAAAKEAMAEKESAHAALEKDLEQLHSATSRHKLLTEMERGREGYYGSVKAVLSQKDRDPAFGKGIYGTVGELLTVPETYEYAVSVSLGSAAQNILTASEADAQRGIAYLKSARAGRATFLPISAMRTRGITGEMDKLLQEPGVLGLAVNLVGFEPDYLPVFSHLLGNVFVAENLARAVALSKKYRQSFRLVTLEGDLLSPGGAMTGGSSGRQNTELLSRTRQINDLEKQIARLSSSRTERDTSLSKLTDHKVYISRLSQSLHSAKEKNAEATKEKAALESEQTAIRTDEEAAGSLDDLQKQLNQQQTALAATESETAEIRKAIAKAEAAQQEHQGNIARIMREAARLEARAEQAENDSRRLHNEVWEAYELTYQSAMELHRPEYEAPFLRSEEKRIKNTMSSLGSVNIGAIDAFSALELRHSFLTAQRDDILEAEAQLQEVIARLTEQMEQQFAERFKIIAKHFNDVFGEMFGGGKASLSMSDPDNILESGIEITAQPPGKNLQSMSLLSGGERALTAIALLFGILRMKPSPFCILDEIESALDDANVVRFAKFLREYAGDTQFIVVTHRKGTMEAADTLYGVTMQELGISKMVSVDFR